MKVVSIHEYAPAVKPRVESVVDGRLPNLKAVRFLFEGSDICWARDLTFSQAIGHLWQRVYLLYGLKYDADKGRWIEENRDYHAP